MKKFENPRDKSLYHFLEWLFHGKRDNSRFNRQSVDRFLKKLKEELIKEESNIDKTELVDFLEKCHDITDILEHGNEEQDLPALIYDLILENAIKRIAQQENYVEKNKESLSIEWEKSQTKSHISEILGERLSKMGIFHNHTFRGYEMYIPINLSQITSKPMREFLEYMNPSWVVEFFIDDEDCLKLLDDYIIHGKNGYEFKWNLKVYRDEEIKKEDKIDLREFMEEIRELNKEKMISDKIVIEKVEKIDLRLEKFEEQKINQFKERVLQNLLIKFPQIIEPNLHYIAEEYRLGQTHYRGDILYLDSKSVRLNVELKVSIPRFKDFEQQLINYLNNIDNDERLMYIAPDMTEKQKIFCKNNNIEYKIINLNSALLW